MLDQIRSVSNRLRLSIAKALIQSVDDSNALQLLELKVFKDEVIGNIERIQNYGFTSNPPKNSETVVAEVAGARDNLIALVVDSAANRIKNLLAGEVAFYSQYGQVIKHDESGNTSFDAIKNIFNGGGRQAARKDDAVSSGDSVFWAWISAVHLVCTGINPTMPPAPTSLTGTIIEGSPSTELPND